MVITDAIVLYYIVLPHCNITPLNYIVFNIIPIAVFSSTSFHYLQTHCVVRYSVGVLYLTCNISYWHKLPGEAIEQFILQVGCNSKILLLTSWVNCHYLSLQVNSSNSNKNQAVYIQN